MLAHLKAHNADMVIGSRFLDADVDWHIPRSRRLGILWYALAVSLLTGIRSTDTTSGFWAMNRRAVEVLATYLPQDYPDVESRLIVHKAGLRQMELPVHMGPRVAGTSSMAHTGHRPGSVWGGVHIIGQMYRTSSSVDACC